MATERVLHGQIVDLASFPAKGTGASSRVLVKRPEFEVLCIDLPTGSSLPTHEVEGPVTMHCLQGELALTVDGERKEMPPGTWVLLDGGTSHAVRATRDSTLLLTIVFVREPMESKR